MNQPEPNHNKAMNIRRAAVALGVSYSFAAALKKAAGIHSRLFALRTIKTWWTEHPDFKIADVYPRKKKPVWRGKSSDNRLSAIA